MNKPLNLAVLLTALIALCMWAVWRIAPSFEVAQQAALDTQIQRLAAAESLRVHAKGAADSLVQLLVINERDGRVPLYQKIDAENAMTDSVVTALSGLSTSATQKERLAQLQSLRAKYMELFVAAVEEIELAGAQGALAQFWSKSQESLREVQVASEQFAKDELVALELARSALATEKIQHWYRLGAALLALLLSALLGGLMGAAWRRKSQP